MFLSTGALSLDVRHRMPRPPLYSSPPLGGDTCGRPQEFLSTGARRGRYGARGAVGAGPCAPRRPPPLTMRAKTRNMHDPRLAAFNLALNAGAFLAG